jgi:hypothetical protein
MLVECPTGGSRGVPTEDPLEAFKKQIEKRKRSRRRTNRVALFPNRYEEEVLFDIGLACASLWNELNYEKRGHSSIESYRLGRGMRLIGIGRCLVLMLVRLLIRMMRLGTLSTSS